MVVASVHSQLRMPSRADDPAHGGRDPQPARDRARALHRAADRPQPPGPGQYGLSRSSTPRRSSRPAGSRAWPSRSTAQPERSDPPDRLLKLAAEVGCLFAIDTDAHAPGQLDWLVNGTVRAERAGITPDRVINTRGAAEIGADRSAGT